MIENFQNCSKILLSVHFTTKIRRQKIPTPNNKPHLVLKLEKTLQNYFKMIYTNRFYAELLAISVSFIQGMNY